MKIFPFTSDDANNTLEIFSNVKIKIEWNYNDFIYLFYFILHSLIVWSELAEIILLYVYEITSFIDPLCPLNDIKCFIFDKELYFSYS